MPSGANYGWMRSTKTRRALIPKARALGIYTDEDVFELVSLRLVLDESCAPSDSKS